MTQLEKDYFDRHHANKKDESIEGHELDLEQLNNLFVGYDFGSFNGDNLTSTDA